ncbi:immunoglobulin-like and fibronectin type III domain-containing protein 1 [Thunnus albacares]|uniref:immunoglobulin-like and fibronectin type III domain-containing protein 1 n=1 Tax=Thunnus albacares TaxID=8236 RepID=UPI001CF6A6C1|nr:immunoglobulin-like and fibronectin type III domain-containing protein 1 [Thunnus albacares]
MPGLFGLEPRIERLRIRGFSLVHQYIQHFNEVSGNKSAGIRRRSKTPGVMITQHVVDLPEGKSTPDFQCKPASVTIQEGKLAVFKAMVKGDPKPEVSWRRTKGNMLDKEKFQNKYDESTGEHILEIHKVSALEADTYKCYAVNEYGKAVCTATLSLTETLTDPSDFRKLLRRSRVGENQTNKADEETEERFWDAMMNADRKDYERICTDFGVADVHWILKQLEEKKKERAQNKCKQDGVIPYDEDARERHCLKTGGRTKDFIIKGQMQKGTGLNQLDVEKANFLDVRLNQLNAKEVNLLDTRLHQVDAEQINLLGAGLHQMDSEDVKLLLTEFKLTFIKTINRNCQICFTLPFSGLRTPVNGLAHREQLQWPGSFTSMCCLIFYFFLHTVSNVDFVIKIQEVQAQEREDALFECVLTHPLPRITWMGKGKVLEDGEKYSITVSDHKMIHRLLIKDCKMQDKGIYSAVAGITSCNAWLVVEVDSDLTSADKKRTRKTTLGDGAGTDLEKVAKQQQIKNREEMEKILAAIKAKHGAEQLTEEKPLTTCGRDSEIIAVTAAGKNSGAVKDKSDAAKASARSEPKGSKEKAKMKNSRADGTVLKSDVSGGVTYDPKNKKRTKSGQEDFDKVTDPNEAASDSDDNEDSTDQVMHSNKSKEGQKTSDEVNVLPNCSLLCMLDPGVQFICGLSDVNAIIGEAAEFTCKVSSEDCEGAWFRDGKKISPDDNFTVTKDGTIHKLVIITCKEEHSGKYRFEADGRKTEAMINVKDPPRFDPEDLSAYSKPVTVKVGHNAIFKLHFVGHEPVKIKWYREGEELQDDNNTKIEKSASHSRLLLSRCQRKDTGEIKIKLKNEHGFIEAISQLIVLDKPTPPLGPAEVTESSATSIEFRWRPPKDNGGSPVINYIMERQQVGRNTWKKIGEIPGVPSYRDTDVDRGRKYCYRIRAVTAEGISEAMETDDMQAGTLAFPGSPSPPKVVSAYDDCINLSWDSPSNKGGSRILGYILEKRKKGSNLWTVVNALDEPIKEKKYAVKDVVAGLEYEFRVTAINVSGAGECSNPSEFVFARDPKKPPGKVTGLKLTETSYTHLVLTWTKPEDKPGIQDEAKGYFVEIRQAECIEWSRCNSIPIIMTSFSVKGLKSMDMYWVRVIATNDGGESAPEELANYVIAMPSPVRPKFTNHRMKSFIVVRAGNSVRITINFEALPRPDIMWLKDNVPVTKRVTISNSDGSSQLLIPSSERSDSGIYTILVKNLAGQETFSTEVRVTDDPKPPGPVELEENVPGTVTLVWAPSPDEKRDDRLHYTVSKLDSTKRTWATVADRLFNNKFTVCNIMHGREYHFRVYAKNDMGKSAPSESPTWGTERKKEKFVVSLPTTKDCDLRCAPTFIVPLKFHTAPKGYECYMSCAVKGDPTPRITWYRNHISINTDANYYISNTCGVCSMLIIRVGPKDMGEYTITAENALGRAECSTVLNVRE